MKPFVQRALDRNQEAARVKQRATAVESAVERVIFNAIPVFQDVSGAQTIFRLDPGFLPKLGLAAEDLSNPIGQGLLAQAHVVQTKDIQRLAAFATKYPGRIVLAAEVAGAEATLVVKNGPPDLRSLALRYRNHPVAQQALRKAVASERCLSAAPVNMRGKGHSQGRDSAHQAAAAYSTTGQSEY